MKTTSITILKLYAWGILISIGYILTFVFIVFFKAVMSSKYKNRLIVYVNVGKCRYFKLTTRYRGTNE